MKVEARTIVVVGGSSGIGLAVAKQAVADGWRVAVVDRQSLTEPLDVGFVSCDLLSPDFAQALNGLAQSEERIDALVVSAGSALNGRLDSYPVEDWSDYFANDTLSALRAIRVFLPKLKETARNRGIADIAVVGSIAGNTAFENAAVYGAIAAARNALGEQLRIELRNDQVRSRAVSVGYVATPLTARMNLKAVTETMAEEPLHPEDVAAIVHHGLNLPPNVAVHDVVVVPTTQGWA